MKPYEVTDSMIESARIALRAEVGYNEFGDREAAEAEDRRLIKIMLDAALARKAWDDAC